MSISSDVEQATTYSVWLQYSRVRGAADLFFDAAAFLEKYVNANKPVTFPFEEAGTDEASDKPHH